MSMHAVELQAKERFAFGANWARFLRHLTDAKIREAENSLREMLGVESLAGMRFLDVGSGSGLFSLAAWRLGATVHSFDYDPQSVACTAELRRRYAGNDPNWSVEEGSVLDLSYLTKLGTHDIVYSWGVLHHTGSMSRALENIIPLVTPGGSLFIAIYNDQGWISKYWLLVKKLYNSGQLAQVALIMLYAPYLVGLRFVLRALTGRLNYERGMSLWYDMIDWLGGYPFEVATPDSICKLYQAHGFTLAKIKTTGRRSGCNEFVFRRSV